MDAGWEGALTTRRAAARSIDRPAVGTMGALERPIMPAPLVIPESVRQCALSNGIEGRRWLEELPEVVAAMAKRWQLELGPSFTGGTASFVAGATDPSGRQCVLKVAMPVPHEAPASFGRSVLVHRLATGRGCVGLFDVDAPARAMLLERLGPNLDQLGLRLPLLLETIVTTLRTFWRPVSEASDLPTGSDKAAWLAGFITRTWEELGRPCPRPVIDRALDYCEGRAAAFDPADAVLVHGDAHGWNTLAVGDGTYKFVDPEGLRSERAHDLAVPMREYNLPPPGRSHPSDGAPSRRTAGRAGWCRSRGGLAVGLHRAGRHRPGQPTRLRRGRRSRLPRGGRTLPVAGPAPPRRS